MKKDDVLKKLLQSVDTRTTPPEGLKERIFGRVLSMESQGEPALSPLERFFFVRPLRAASVIAIPVTGFLWAIMGSGFINLFSGLIQ